MANWKTQMCETCGLDSFLSEVGGTQAVVLRRSSYPTGTLRPLDWQFTAADLKLLSPCSARITCATQAVLGASKATLGSAEGTL